MLAERIRGAVAEQPVDSDSGPLRVTISIGVAEVADGLDLKTALAAADHALYQAKGQGRDLVVAMQRPELALRRVS
jgi:diguanylate cyclase (GGDEF)-like protein